jgi:hypothetical protein
MAKIGQLHALNNRSILGILLTVSDFPACSGLFSRIPGNQVLPAWRDGLKLDFSWQIHPNLCGFDTLLVTRPQLSSFFIFQNHDRIQFLSGANR